MGSGVFTKGVKKELIGYVQELNLEFGTTLVRSLTNINPLDTGLSRSNWHITFTPDSNNILPVSSNIGTVGNAAVMLQGKDLTKDFNIVNNVPYIVPLLNGHSKQAKRGWMDRSISHNLDKVYGV